MARYGSNDWGWRPYVSQAERKAQAERARKEQAKKGVKLKPVSIDGRKIAWSFWGKSWCDNLESYADFANRLPRGRTYVRNGSVIDLAVESGKVRAQVMGSELYKVEIDVDPLAKKRWSGLVGRCAGEVSSVVEVLQGRLPKTLLETLADRQSGLFPAPKEMRFSCSCPDWASMCKHVAAALYGVGARLDHEPEVFFLLRGVEVTDLAAEGAGALAKAAAPEKAIAHDELADIFGIEIEGAPPAAPVIARPRKKKPSALEPRPATPEPASKKPRSPKTMSWPALNARGVSDRTIASWVKRGWLGPPDARSRYRLTDRALAELSKRERRK